MNFNNEFNKSGSLDKATPFSLKEDSIVDNVVPNDLIEKISKSNEHYTFNCQLKIKNDDLYISYDLSHLSKYGNLLSNNLVFSKIISNKHVALDWNIPLVATDYKINVSGWHNNLFNLSGDIKYSDENGNLCFIKMDSNILFGDNTIGYALENKLNKSSNIYDLISHLHDRISQLEKLLLNK